MSKKKKTTTPKQRTASSAFNSKNIEAFTAAVKDKITELKQDNHNRLSLTVSALAFKAVEIAKKEKSPRVTTNHLLNAFTSIQRGVENQRASAEGSSDNVVKRATVNTQNNTQTAADILGNILAQD